MLASSALSDEIVDAVRDRKTGGGAMMRRRSLAAMHRARAGRVYGGRHSDVLGRKRRRHDRRQPYARTRRRKTPYGESGGYSPAVTTVAVGSQIQFINSRQFRAHRNVIPGATTFPAGSPFGIAALQQHGTTLSGGFSSGAMQAGRVVADDHRRSSRDVLFGCFFHYGAPMRGAIVAQ